MHQPLSLPDAVLCMGWGPTCSCSTPYSHQILHKFISIHSPEASLWASVQADMWQLLDSTSVMPRSTGDKSYPERGGCWFLCCSRDVAIFQCGVEFRIKKMTRRWLFLIADIFWCNSSCSRKIFACHRITYQSSNSCLCSLEETPDGHKGNTLLSTSRTFWISGLRALNKLWVLLIHPYPCSTVVQQLAGCPKKEWIESGEGLLDWKKWGFLRLTPGAAGMWRWVS